MKKRELLLGLALVSAVSAVCLKVMRAAGERLSRKK